MLTNRKPPPCQNKLCSGKTRFTAVIEGAGAFPFKMGQKFTLAFLVACQCNRRYTKYANH